MGGGGGGTTAGDGGAGGAGGAGASVAAGAVGGAAIYTEHAEAIHIIRKVILRVGSYLNYLILKLH